MAEVRRRTPDVKVVAITLGETESEVIQLAEAGVAGHVLPDGSRDDLGIAVESAVRGELYCPPRVAFTPREVEILQLVDRGMTNNQIARQVGIEVTTAKNHVHNILKKLHVHRRMNASAWYRQGEFHLKLETERP